MSGFGRLRYNPHADDKGDTPLGRGQKQRAADGRHLVHGGILTIELRIGIGHDTHRLAVGGPLRLGGMDIPHDHHALGHSDADVLLHAVTDALLGAARLGDIGDRFPDTDERNRGRDSAGMLLEAYRAVQAAGFELVNLDAIVFAQRPRLGPLKQTLAERIAGILGVPSECVAVKAKTGEGLGAIGEERALAAECVALLQRTASKG